MSRLCHDSLEHNTTKILTLKPCVLAVAIINATGKSKSSKPPRGVLKKRATLLKSNFGMGVLL